ncbi:c-type cytochrome biogenesis protein CcmI [Alkalimonas collagenimarina]|uniref:C-type cytochrome biogenesis protein CcmI n=1 Tax=Alkalimonas collagenimarina TaxID=400390 RepID=A0ABT9H2N8_9GAMM|nr:c-type cytochrome biogenesis protein CcmI [Alkalimonas collagenimarina]MDP4537575.1 c-type cytochrome biogenesis protein CcmI [Alkalimonas collagenimarina]
MIWQLLFGALLMIALSVIFIIWPRKSTAGQHQTPAQLFEERMQLLATARDNDELAEDDFVSAANDLKQQFLEQEATAVQLSSPKHKLMWHAGILLSVVVIVAGIYSWNGHYQQLAHWQLAQENMTEFGERALLDRGEPLSEDELASFALALRTKLAREGDDAVAWMLLGRLWMSQGFLMDSIEAFEKALQMTPNRPALLISYSQALLVVGGDDKLAKAGRALARVLTQDPEHIDALSLLALVAYEKGDMDEAITAWTLLLDRLPTSDPRYQAVIDQLDKLGHSVEARQERTVQLALYVEPGLRRDYPDASVFIFVRQANGPALPLAAQRIPVPAGEINLLLTEQMAMQSGWTLASADEVEVVARFSRSGNVEEREGDLEVVSEVQTFTEPAIKLSLRLKTNE